jgi:hypothetical protein
LCSTIVLFDIGILSIKSPLLIRVGIWSFWVNSGDYAAVGAVIAAAAAVVALYFTAIAAKAARDQTKVQQKLREDAAQPYVWADVRTEDEHGVVMMLVVGNSGPTVATDVKVRIDPPLPNIEQLQGASAAQERLARGFKSLPPGRTLGWWLGQGWNVIAKEGPQVHRITITAQGPFGPIPELSYDIDLAEFREQEMTPQGSLNGLTNAVKELTKKITS